MYTIPACLATTFSHLQIGHAIYSLDIVKDIIKVSTKTLLEEPRAELTALHTLRLLLQRSFVDQASCSHLQLHIIKAPRNSTTACPCTPPFPRQVAQLC